MGKILGSIEGPEEGSSLGTDEGTKVGSTVGTTLGKTDGSLVGSSDGFLDGRVEGMPDGSFEGRMGDRVAAVTTSTRPMLHINTAANKMFLRAEIDDRGTAFCIKSLRRGALEMCADDFVRT